MKRTTIAKFMIRLVEWGRDYANLETRQAILRWTTHNWDQVETAYPDHYQLSNLTEKLHDVARKHHFRTKPLEKNKPE